MRQPGLTILAAAFLATAAPAPAADRKPQTEKDLCLLYAQNCADRTDTLLEKIARLKEEIAKGTTVYSPAEIKRLEVKLQEAEDLLDIILYGPPSGGGRR